ncbi:DPY30 domain-containing protein 2-like isoform X4 [Zootoca vivipara]|uniref:DPY30 domain-containing protein 2-like isoform X4 n=1 Tax=Zootoca vivipara TaxID=8524 RepID=UPI00293BC8ED|nr:DPY30 domain-containing protein 2-like isoform X4 [Zootoca vivipara]
MYHIHAVWHKMGMDVKYLKECIGRCLAEGLAEAADRRPVDPIDFLAHFIYNYRNRLNEEEKKRTEQKDARIPEEHETTAESKKETLEDKMEQGYISAVKAELGETPGEQNTSTTLQEALTEITMDEDFNRIPQETMDDRGESQLEHDGVNQNEHDTQTEDDTEDEEDTPDEESKSSQDLNLE